MTTQKRRLCANFEIVVATCVLAIIAHKISCFPHHVRHNLQKGICANGCWIDFETVFLQKLFLRWNLKLSKHFAAIFCTTGGTFWGIVVRLIAQKIFSLPRRNLCKRDTYRDMKYFLQVFFAPRVARFALLAFFRSACKATAVWTCFCCQNALPFFQLSTICHVYLCCTIKPTFANAFPLALCVATE